MFSATPSFYLSAYIKHNWSDDDFFLIGGAVDPQDKTKVLGDAKFFVDIKSFPPSAAVDIEAAIVFPMLRSYGYVEIEVNQTMASFEGELSLFRGIFNPYALVEWKWDMSYFYMRLQQILLARGLIILNDVELKAAPRQLNVDFDCKLTVLFFLEVEASFAVDIDMVCEVVWRVRFAGKRMQSLTLIHCLFILSKANHIRFPSRVRVWRDKFFHYC